MRVPRQRICIRALPPCSVDNINTLKSTAKYCSPPSGMFQVEQDSFDYYAINADFNILILQVVSKIADYPYDGQGLQISYAIVPFCWGQCPACIRHRMYTTIFLCLREYCSQTRATSISFRDKAFAKIRISQHWSFCQ